MTPRANDLSYNRLAGIGLALIISPLLFASAAVTEYVLGIGQPLSGPLDFIFATPSLFRVFNILSPIVFLGGLMAAALTNLYAVVNLNTLVNLNTQWRRSTLVTTVAVRANLWNLSVVAVSGVLLTTFALYAFVENFTTRPH